MKLKGIRELEDTIEKMDKAQRDLYKDMSSVSCAINNIKIK